MDEMDEMDGDTWAKESTPVHAGPRGHPRQRGTALQERSEPRCSDDHAARVFIRVSNPFTIVQAGTSMWSIPSTGSTWSTTPPPIVSLEDLLV